MKQGFVMVEWLNIIVEYLRDMFWGIVVMFHVKQWLVGGFVLTWTDLDVPLERMNGIILDQGLQSGGVGAI